MGELVNKVKQLWPSGLIREGVLNMKLILIGLLGVALLLVGGLLDQQPVKNINEPVRDSVKQNVNSFANRSYEEILEGKMANLLSQVKGAGTVAVSITLDSSATQEHAKNIVRESKVIQENDSGGGTRTTTETKENEQVLMSKESGTDRPVMVRESKPVIKGVLVIADGAHDSLVKANLSKAVEIGLGVPPYKITVLPQRK